VSNIKLFSLSAARVIAAFAMSLSTAAPVRAADWSYKAFQPPAWYTADFGLRGWYGTGSTKKNLFDTTGSQLVSRLTYDKFSIVGGEAYTRFDFNSGWYLKGYLGGTGLWNGTLKDEDFDLPPPDFTEPYSATTSAQKFGSLFYFNADVGFNVVKGPDFRVGAFVGYHFLRETVSAYGCAQIAASPDICNPLVPDTTKVISQVNNWNSLRIGLDGSFDIGDRFKIAVEGAYLPFVQMFGADSHWLRIDPSATVVGAFTGPVPEDGNGWGYQLEAVLSYRVNEMLNVGLGARYWHMETSGHTHFEGHVVGTTAFPQALDWRVDNLGVFVQAGLKLGPYPVIGHD
jgi:outer membrane protease